MCLLKKYWNFNFTKTMNICKIKIYIVIWLVSINWVINRSENNSIAMKSILTLLKLRVFVKEKM